MKLNKLWYVAAVSAISLTLCGCSFRDEADVASYNLSKEADNFNVYRQIKVINCQSDEILLEFEGWCAIVKDNADNQLEVTYRIGEDKYAKDFIGLNDRVTYLVTQLDGKEVSKYQYTWKYHSKGKLIPVELVDNDAN